MESDMEKLSVDNQTFQNNILLELIKEVCDPSSNLDTALKDKVNKIIAECDLAHYSSLHNLSTPNDSISTLLGLIKEVATELTFEEQSQLNETIIQKIQEKIPLFTSELNNLKRSLGNGHNLRKQHIKDLQSGINEKLNILKEQENEKIELMLEWLNHKLQDVSNFSLNTSEMLTLKTRILELKSRILHLQILRNVFTETNQSIKAYSEIHKDLKDSIKETEQKIMEFQKIIESDYS